MPARAAVLTRRAAAGRAPSTVTVGPAQSGTQSTTASTTQVVTLPTHAASDTLLAVLSRNVTSTAYTASDGVALTEQAQVGTRRLAVVSFSAPAALTSLTLTGSSGVWSWAVFNIGNAAPAGSAGNAIGNSTTSPVEFPTAAITAATGSEVALAVAGTNSTATWSGFSATTQAALPGAPGLFVGSGPVTAGATSVTFPAVDRANAGSTRLESSLVLVLRSPT